MMNFRSLKFVLWKLHTINNTADVLDEIVRTSQKLHFSNNCIQLQFSKKIQFLSTETIIENVGKRL